MLCLGVMMTHPSDPLGGTAGDTASTLRRTRQVQVLILAVVGSALAVTVWQSFTSVAAVSRAVGLGQGETFLHAVRYALRPGQVPNEYTLQGVLEDQWRHGLRCVLLLTPDARVTLRAGTCETPDAAMPELMARFRPGQFTRIRARLRMLDRPPPPLPPPGGGEPAWGADAPPPPPPPPPGFGPPPGPGPPSFLIEFEPVKSMQMHAAAVRTLVIGGATLLALAAAAVAVWRLSVRAEQLQAVREHDRRLAGLGEMSAVVAHELRNPLASLKGHAQLLAEALPPEGREHRKAERVVQEALRLEQLCEDLLGFVRPDTITPQEVDAVRLLRDAVAALAPAAIRVVAPAAAIRWRLDPLHMHQVLTNLLRNAVQSEPNGTSPEASASVDNGALVFTVRDFGGGIPPDKLESIFDPFVTARPRGTGLGLAVARRIVGLHGGRITATNHPHGGALFRVVIPAAAGGPDG